MGGHGSGRYRTRNFGSIERVLALDIRALRKSGVIREGEYVWRAWRWTWAGTDGEVGSIGIAADLTNPTDRHVVLGFSVGGESRRQKIAIEALPTPFGGLRYYFRCPSSGERCEVLGCVRGYFASRRANRLSYASQTDDKLGRLGRARSKAEDQALGRCGHPKPRGANRKRLVAKWFEREMEFEALFEAEAARRFGGRI